MPAKILQAPWVYLAVAVLALAAYGGGLRVGFVSDDHYWLLAAVHGLWLKALTFDPHSNAPPFELWLHGLKYALFGFNALGFHLLDLGGHVLACLLLFALARSAGFSSTIAGAAAVLASVAAAPVQAVYWTSADAHLWATVGALASLLAYVRYRSTGGPAVLLWLAVALALIAALTKAEGITVVFGVLAYEIFWREHPPWTRASITTLAGRVAPFAAAAAVFFAWELTATDRLRSASQLGVNMLGRALAYIRIIVLPASPLDLLARGQPHRLGSWVAALAATVVAVVLLTCLIAAFTRRSAVGLGLIWVGSLLAALTLTDPPQSRYVYFATLVTFVAVATGGAVLVEWLPLRGVALMPVTAVAILLMLGVVGVQALETRHSSAALRAAERESAALSAAVLKDHPVLMPRTTIYLLHSPLDPGSAQWVFADPRLGPDINANVPAIAFAASPDAVAPPTPGSTVLIYEREADGRYVERAPTSWR